MKIWLLIMLLIVSRLDIFNIKNDETKEKNKPKDKKTNFVSKFTQRLNKTYFEDEDELEGLSDREGKNRPSESVRRSYVGGREFREIFPRDDYTLEEIREIESRLSEEEYLSHRHQIYELEEEIARKERYLQTESKTFSDDISILDGLSDTQKMVVYKEILDRPKATRKNKRR